MAFVGIIGTNSTESTNRSLMQFIASHFADRAQVEPFEIRPLPAFRAKDPQTPEVSVLIDAVVASDGVIIATPEYDHTIPAALKSALEWLSGPDEAMKRKPVMIVGASYGRLGTSRAQDHLRQILTSSFLRARVLPDEFLLGNSTLAFDEEGKLLRESDVANLEAVFDQFLAFAQTMNSLDAKLTGKDAK